jgi:nitrous oxidase accessory protein
MHRSAAGQSRAIARTGNHIVATDAVELAARILAAQPGERIVVPPGTYRGATLVIDKPLELVGAGDAILDGEGKRQLIEVRSDDVLIRGFVLRNIGTTHVDDRAAIRIENSKRCRIEDNRIENGFFGIYLAKVDGCEIRGNQLTAEGTSETSSGNGIHLWSSQNVIIENNTIEGYRDGIYFEFVKDGRVANNRSEHNLRYGLHFMFSDRCRYEANIFRSNKAGVAVMYTTAVEMVDNEFLDNWGSATFGLLLKDIRDSRIEQNRFHSNSVALYMEGSDRVSVKDNDFKRNGWAVKVLANSEKNDFVNNNFEANTFDVSTNSRQSYNRFEGNYWDAYRGYDLDRDGRGDVPHRPVRLFSILVERNEPSLILLRSFLVQLMDAAESVIPALTPEALVDEKPRMVPSPREAGSVS